MRETMKMCCEEMLNEKITLDKGIFDALASEIRVELLKKLDERAKTISELSRETQFYKSAVHRNLSILVDNGLVKRKGNAHKWVYYSLTRKGEKILNPQRAKISILL
jgi:predicted transcriptional regulator